MCVSVCVCVYVCVRALLVDASIESVICNSILKHNVHV